MIDVLVVHIVPSRTKHLYDNRFFVSFYNDVQTSVIILSSDCTLCVHGTGDKNSAEELWMLVVRCVAEILGLSPYILVN